jgi:hypothetical protein
MWAQSSALSSTTRANKPDSVEQNARFWRIPGSDSIHCAPIPTGFRISQCSFVPFFSQQHVETATDSTESAGELLLYGKSGSTNRTTEIWGRLHPVFFPVERTSSRILTKSDSMLRVSGFATNPVVICPWPWLFRQELWIDRWQEKGQSELAPCVLKRSNALRFANPASPHLGPRHVATHGCRDDPGVWPWFKVTGRRRRPGVEPCRVWCLFSCLRHIWPAVVP